MFGSSFFAASNFASAYQEIEKEKRPAHVRGDLECVKCGCCCWLRPCCLVPSDVDKIAAFLKRSTHDLFENFLVVDKIRGHLVVLPIRASQEELAGGFLPDENTFDINTPCIFLAENSLGGTRCKIHKVKPRGGLEWECWRGDEHSNLSAYEWSEADLKAHFNYTHHAWE